MPRQEAGVASGRSYATRLAVVLALILAAYADDRFGRLLEPLTWTTIQATRMVLGFVGIETVQQGHVLGVPGGFSYEIYFRCTGYLPAACLAAAILVAPLPLSRKLPGLLVGVAFLFALNLLRLVQLSLLAVTHPSLFGVAHRYFWEPLTATAVVAVWLLWRRRVGL